MFAVHACTVIIGEIPAYDVVGDPWAAIQAVNPATEISEVRADVIAGYAGIGMLMAINAPAKRPVGPITADNIVPYGRARPSVAVNAAAVPTGPITQDPVITYSWARIQPAIDSSPIEADLIVSDVIVTYSGTGAVFAEDPTPTSGPIPTESVIDDLWVGGLAVDSSPVLVSVVFAYVIIRYSRVGTEAVNCSTVPIVAGPKGFSIFQPAVTQLGVALSIHEPYPVPASGSIISGEENGISLGPNC